MRRCHIIAIIIISAMLMFTGIISASAETLEECMNNLILQKQRYNIDYNTSIYSASPQECSIDPRIGQMTLTQTDYTLPGRNGLDVNITRIYQSGQTSEYEMRYQWDGTKYEYLVSDWYRADYWSLYERKYNLGVGVRFSFPTIEIIKSSDNTAYRYLHSESGATYRLMEKDESGRYELDGYELDDIQVIEDKSYTHNGMTSKYVLIEKDGKKTYFSDAYSGNGVDGGEGNILAIVDRYGNTIKFEYKEYIYNNQAKARMLISKIIDTVGREIKIDYDMDDRYDMYPITGYDLKHKFAVRITTPDNHMIVYDKSNYKYEQLWGGGNYYALASTKEQLRSVSMLEDASQYGKNGNYGEEQYYFWYENRSFDFTYSGEYPTNMQKKNSWSNIDFIKYSQTNKGKAVSYDFETSRLGETGKIEKLKVSEHKDVLLDAPPTTNAQGGAVYAGSEEKKTSYTYGGDSSGTYHAAEELWSMDFEEGHNNKDFVIMNGSSVVTSKAYAGSNSLSIGEGGARLRITLPTDSNMTFYQNGVVMKMSILNVANNAISYDEMSRATNWVKRTVSMAAGTYEIYFYKNGTEAYIDDLSFISKSNASIYYETGFETGFKCIDMTASMARFSPMVIRSGVGKDGGYAIVPGMEYGSNANLSLEVELDNPANLYYEEKTAKTGWEQHKIPLQSGKQTLTFSAGNGAQYLDNFKIMGNNYSDPIPKVYVDMGFEDNSYIGLGWQDDNKFLDMGQWKQDEKAAKDGKYGLNSQTANSTATIIISIDEDAELFFDIKGTPDAAGSAYPFINVQLYDSHDIVDNIIYTTDTWEEKTIRLPKGRRQIRISSSGGGEVYIDNLMIISGDYIKEAYSTTITEKRGEHDVNIKYCYDTDNMLLAVETIGYNQSTLETRKYDENKMLTKSSIYYFDSSTLWHSAYYDQTKTYTYDNYGNLLTYTGPEYKDAKVVYAYESPKKYNKLKSRTVKNTKGDELTKTTYEIDDKGNTTREIRHNTGGKDSALTELAYDSYGNIISKSSYVWDVIYDGSGNIVHIPQNPNTQKFTTIYEYNQAGGTAAGLCLTREYNEQDSSSIAEKHYEYNFSTGLKTKESDSVTSTFYEYDKYKRIKGVTVPLTSGQSLKTQYYYENYGINGLTNKNYTIKVIDAGGNTSIYAYDIFGNMTKEIRSLDNTTINTYTYDSQGNLIKHTDADLIDTVYTYDSLNRFSGRQRYVNGEQQDVVGVWYHVQDEWHLFNYAYKATIRDEEGYITSHYMDNANRVIATDINPLKDKTYVIQTKYDQLGNKIETSSAAEYIVEETGYTQKAIGPDHAPTTFAYDKLGRMSTKTDALGNTTAYTYNAIDKIETVTYPGGKKTEYEYDTAGRLMMEKTAYISDFNLDDSYPSHAYISYKYDQSNNITATEKGTGEGYVDSRVTYVYNERGLLSGKYDMIDYSKSAYTYYEYDTVGNQTLEKVFADAANLGKGHIETVSAYDDLGRTTSEITTAYYDGTMRGVSKTTYPEYDLNNNVKAIRKYYSDSGYFETSFEYDYRDLPIAKHEQIDEDGTRRNTTYQYDKKGNLTSTTMDWKGNQISSSVVYDGVGRVVSSTNALGQTTRYAYDKNGNKIAQADARYPDGDILSAPGIRYSYDALNRQTTQAVRDENGAETVVSAKEYDGRGNVTKIMDGEGYANGKTGSIMKYDNCDNMTQIISAEAYAKDSRNIGKKMLYDGAGRLIAQKEYDSSVSADGAYSLEYLYNPTKLLYRKNNTPTKPPVMLIL